jgi:hypothetical protein
VALLKLNEGSLLRRTLVYVGTFVVGSIAFISLMSFVLVSIAKGLANPSASEASADGDEAPAAAALPSATSPTARVKPPTRPPRKRAPAAAAAPSPRETPKED